MVPQDFGKQRECPGVWSSMKFRNSGWRGAHQMWRDPESGLWFRFVVHHRDREVSTLIRESAKLIPLYQFSSVKLIPTS